MPPEDLESEAGQTVAVDATRRMAEAGDLREIPHRPAALAAVADHSRHLGGHRGAAAQSDGRRQVGSSEDRGPGHKTANQKATEAVNKQLADRQKKAEQEGLKDAEQLFKKLEEGTKQMASSPPDREKALSRLNDLSRQLAERRQQIGGAEKVKEELNPLKKLDHGPADKFAQALANGEFNKALEELKDMQKALEDNKLDQKEKEKLANQMEQMKEKLEQLAENHEKAQAEMQKKADEMRKNGQNADAEKLEEQIRQMQNQNPQMEQLKDLAKQMGQCANCMKQGNGQQAAAAMKQAQNALGNMKKQLDEMQMLDAAMDELAQAKDKMNCEHCGGAGCKFCQGEDDRMGKRGPGGLGRGAGERPEAKSDTKSYDSQVKQKVGRGSATVEGMVEGPNMKGDVQNQIRNDVDAVRRGDTDPETGRQIPKKYGEQVREYMDNFREGK